MDPKQLGLSLKWWRLMHDWNIDNGIRFRHSDKTERDNIKFFKTPPAANHNLEEHYRNRDKKENKT